MNNHLFTLAARSLALAVRRPATTLSVGLVLVMPLLGCEEPSQPLASGSFEVSSLTPSHTMGTGSVSTLVGRATIADAFNVKRKTGDWKARVDSDPLDVAVQSIVFQPGGQSGWHTHPGPVFILVVQGTMTFYESNDPTCAPIVRTAGQGYLDSGDHAHIARNETQLEARNVVTYFAPPGALLRIDAPAPGNCAF